MKVTTSKALILGVLILSLAGCATITGVGSLSAPPPSVSAQAPAARMGSALAEQGSPEEAIQLVIQRANAEQEQAIASRDSSVMRDTSTDAYYEDMARTNQDLLAGGVVAIKLVSLDWGPITVSGTSATATTYETWSSEFGDGTTERSRDRNDYTLVQQGGVWRIQADDHPDGAITTAPGAPQARPAPPERTPPSSTDPGQAIAPRGRGLSSNWAGYVARGGGFTSVTGTWTVPEPAAATGVAADAAWVGIGGESTRDLIQAGTQQNAVSAGRIQYSAWIETLPQVSRTVPFPIHPGDSVTVSIAEQQVGTWAIDFRNNTTGGSYSRTVQYNSSHSSAEWVQEAPSGRGGILPLSDFGSVTFTEASTVQRSQTVNLADTNAQSITMINGANQPIAIPSRISDDGAGFTVTRTENNASDGGRGPSRTPRRPILGVNSLG